MKALNEQTMLVLAATLDPDEDQLTGIRRAFGAIHDKDSLIDLAVREGLVGFLYRSLLKAGILETFNSSQKQRLYTAYYLTIHHNLKLIHALNEIQNLLMQKQVRVILMQGISLLQQVYRDIGLRPMNDMDLWVLPEQYNDLVDCFVSQGFEQNSIYPHTFSKGEVVVDIHTHILWGDRIRSRDSLIDIDQKEIFGNAQLLTNENTAALCLSPSDQFIYLSLHALKHNLERLIWLVDIKSLVDGWENSEWQALIVRTEELGQQATLGYMLYVLTNIFDLKLPSEILSFPDGWTPNLFERKVLDRRINGSPISTWSQLVLISADKGLRERILFFKETLFPRPKILRQVFPDYTHLSNRQLYWKRVLQILGSFKI